MIYEWKCDECGEVVEVRRTVDDYERGPTYGDDELRCGHDEEGYYRIISRTSTPFEHLRDSGMLTRTHWHKSNDNWK